MMMSANPANGNIFRVTGPLCGEFAGSRWVPLTKASDIFFDLRLNKQLSKQSQGWWFETPSCPLWRHYDESNRPHFQDCFPVLGQSYGCSSVSQVTLMISGKIATYTNTTQQNKERLVFVITCIRLYDVLLCIRNCRDESYFAHAFEELSSLLSPSILPVLFDMRDHFGYGLSQWEDHICNAISHWLSPYSDKSLDVIHWNIDVNASDHDDVNKWKHYPRYWPFVSGIHRWHKGQRLGALMSSLICVWINSLANNHEACDLRRHRAHYDVTVMFTDYPF